MSESGKGFEMVLGHQTATGDRRKFKECPVLLYFLSFRYLCFSIIFLIDAGHGGYFINRIALLSHLPLTTDLGN